MGDSDLTLPFRALQESASNLGMSCVTQNREPERGVAMEMTLMVITVIFLFARLSSSRKSALFSHA